MTEITSKMDEVTASVWATSTDLPGSDHERKTYRVILRDPNYREIRFDLQVHADGKIVAVPYVPADYAYLDLDMDDDDEVARDDLDDDEEEEDD